MNPQHSSAHSTTPLSALWHWLMTGPNQQAQNQCHVGPVATAPHGRTSTTNPQMPGIASCTSNRPGTRRPLRVLRVVEAGLAPAQIGRLRISGRMADVCAELDRLAACEAKCH